IVAAWAAAAHLAAAGLAAAVWSSRGFRAVMEETIRVDGLALTLTAIVGVGGAVCIGLARPVISGGDREGEFYAMLTFASLAAVVLAMAADAALLGLAIGALGLATFVMTGYHRASRRGNEASIKYYVFGTVSGAMMLYGLSWWFGLAGTTNLELVGEALARGPRPVVIGSTALVLAGLGYKAAVVPFHFWAPDVYEGAPLPVAAYLSVLPKLAALVALARLLPLALPDDTAGWTTAIAAIAVATMTLGNLAAIPQRNVVRLLAYSSIAQSGYLLMGVAALEGSDAALPALVFYAIAYGAMNLAAFAVVIAVQRERGSVDVEAFRGLGRRHPWWTAALVLAFLSLIGIPPLAGFVGKLELFTASIDAGQAWLAAAAVVNTVVSVYPYLRVVGPAVLEPGPRGASGVRGATSPPAGPLGAALAVTALATIAFGVAAEPLLALAGRASMLG
ncbi:MAG: NADH-quinone oxidoreductase subunit N, partial [Thermoleophilia bacterium]|nr:NADH-quinone oxidoreductase subunit N [Thermoleophilia bacterium]